MAGSEPVETACGNGFLKGTKRAGYVEPAIGQLQDGAELRPPPPIAAGPNILSLDFTGRGELLKALRERADKEFRTIEAQVFFYIFICVSSKSWLPDRMAE